MKNIRLLILLLVLVTAFVSCKKKDDPAPVVIPPTKTELLTAKPWKITSLKVNPALPDSIYLGKGTTGSVSDFIAFFTKIGASCFNDNIRNFNKTSAKFSFEQGTKVCSGDVIYGQGSWILSSDEKTLALSFSGVASINTTDDVFLDPDVYFTWYILETNTINYTIVELTETTFSYTYKLGSYTFTETLSNL